MSFRPLLPPTLVLILAFALRVVGLNDVPPGWRDDEVIETTVHARRVLDGEWPLYFVEAEGHEPLYHYVSAGWIALFGDALPTVRMVSAFFGLLSIAAAYRLARQLFGREAALLAALLLAISFWSLMYSRTKIRHVSALVFVLLAFSAWWEGVRRRRTGALMRSGLYLGLALYTYFAALTAPLILLAVGLHLLLIKRIGRGYPIRGTILLPLGIATLMYLPLFLSIRSSGASAERLAVVGAPLQALLTGDPTPALQTMLDTLRMFASSGDPEALYNLPGRPIFGPLAFTAFAAGVLLALVRWRDPRYGFLLIWLTGGLAPGFISVPAASLGHTITAQPVVYLLITLPIVEASRWLSITVTTSTARSAVPGAARPLERPIARSAVPGAAPAPGRRGRRPEQILVGAARRVFIGLSLLLAAVVGLRDLPDYFRAWPQHDHVRFLYRADLHAQMAEWRRQPPEQPLAIGGSLSFWDGRALRLESGDSRLDVRWFRSEWAFIYPGSEIPTVYYYFPAIPASPSQLLTELAPRRVLTPTERIQASYPHGFALQGYTLTHANGQALVHLFWQATSDYIAPAPAIGSSPESPPQPFRAFVHLLDGEGNWIAGADRFDVDAFTLQPGDAWIQLHPLTISADLPPGTYTLATGLYDPIIGERFRTTDGRDTVRLGNYQ